MTVPTQEPRIIPISGASMGDISHAMTSIDNLTKLYMSAVKATLDPLNENLSERGPDVEEFIDFLSDLVADHLTGPLTRIHSRREDGWEG
jgi:hypothetical protein